MTRSTQKEINSLLDEIKTELDLKSRSKASEWFYSVVAKAFKREGFTLSYYLNGEYTITNDNTSYKPISFDQLFTPKLTCK